eukprot:scaffold1920_cov50-Attheya_sp.AAC.1
MPDLGGLGPGLAGEKISLTESVVLVQRQLGEGASGTSLAYAYIAMHMSVLSVQGVPAKPF